MNAVIAFEVFKFLKNSLKLVRNPQPSLLKVSLQAAFVYIYSIVLNLILFSFFSKYHGSEEMFYVMTIGFPLLLLFTLIGPFIFMISIFITIWKRGYMKTEDKRYKNLAIYFLRIQVAFILLWVPITIIMLVYILPVTIDYGYGVVLKINSHESVPPLYAIMMIMISLQALLTVIMALLKPDVQKMVTNLFTGCCCCHNESNNIKESNNSKQTSLEPSQESSPSMPISSEENEDDKGRTAHDLDLQMPQVDDNDNDIDIDNNNDNDNDNEQQNQI